MQQTCPRESQPATISRVAKLYFGDNLGVLRDYIEDESVDLIYLDPPFNSNRSYNLLFADKDRQAAPAQITAFKDTWRWDTTVERNLQELVGDAPSRSPVPPKVQAIVRAMHAFLGDNDMMAYLTMMGLRLVELHRVLRPTGTLYLHCDPTASHYLKVLLDGIFGAENLRNEIIWKRTNARSASGRWPRLHDVLLFYGKSALSTFNPIEVPGEPAKMPHTLVKGPDGKKYQTFELTAPHLRFGETGEPWRGFHPAQLGRHWGNPPSVLDEWDRQGLIHWPKKKGGWPRRRAKEPFTPEQRMVTVGDVWTDIDRLNQSAKERIGYPTQKPVALLERIVTASSKPGDVVLDPFCGCGTTIEAAQRLGREWIGIDITHLAVKTIRERIAKVFGPLVYTVGGNPADADSARVLAETNPHQFQDWAVRFVGGRAVGGAKTSKKGGDKGIDGELFYQSAGSAKRDRIVISVKGGKTVNPAMVRELRGTIEREGSPIGVLITAAQPTKQMRTEAARAKQWPAGGRLYSRIQILTVDDLFHAQRVEHPGDNVTEGANPPPEQLLLFDQVKRGPLKVPPHAEKPARDRKRRT